MMKRNQYNKMKRIKVTKENGLVPRKHHTVHFLRLIVNVLNIEGDRLLVLYLDVDKGG